MRNWFRRRPTRTPDPSPIESLGTVIVGPGIYRITQITLRSGKFHLSIEIPEGVEHTFTGDEEYRVHGPDGSSVYIGMFDYKGYKDPWTVWQVNLALSVNNGRSMKWQEREATR